jgi:hypothetical protein
MNGPRRPVKRLFDMEIDEVSMVDRPANQHATIMIAKSEEGGMSVFDEDGYEVDEDLLEHGDVVFGEDGEAYVFDEFDEYDDELIGKAAEAVHVPGMGHGWDDGPTYRRPGRGMVHVPGGGHGWDDKGTFMRDTLRRKMSRNKGKIGIGLGAAGAATAVGGGAYYAHRKGKGPFAKSSGDYVLEELAKADSDEARDRIIADVVDAAEIAKAAADEAWLAAGTEREARYEEAFVSKAAEYNLPVDPYDLGMILKSVADVLDDDQLELLDNLFDSVGDILYEEYGYEGGGSDTGVLDMVESYADEYVTKADVTDAQAITDVFEINPDAYDAYLEMGY